MFFHANGGKWMIQEGYKSINSCLIPVSGLSIDKDEIVVMTRNKGKEVNFDFCLQNLFSLQDFL
jgi:hypothetical protein